MTRMLLLLLVMAVAGCAGMETAPGNTKEAVAEPPCDASKVPQRPVLSADSLTGDEDVWTMGKTLWADRKARIAYELQLEKIADECTKRSAAR